jgi:hypothetical protein
MSERLAVDPIAQVDAQSVFGHCRAGRALLEPPSSSRPRSRHDNPQSPATTTPTTLSRSPSSECIPRPASPAANSHPASRRKPGSSSGVRPFALPFAAMTKVLDIQTNGHLRVLRLNRPDRKNALNGELIEAIVTAVRDAAAEDDVWAIALTGNGDAFVPVSTSPASAEIATAKTVPIPPTRSVRETTSRSSCGSIAKSRSSWA